MKRQLLSLFLFISMSQAGDLVQLSSVHAPMGEQLFKNNDSYLIQRLGKTHEVQPCFVDKSLRERSVATLMTMQENGYINISRLSDGEYKLDYLPRGKGGGPILGKIFYWVVKVGSYAGIAGAAVGKAQRLGGDTGDSLAAFLSTVSPAMIDAALQSLGLTGNESHAAAAVAGYFGYRCSSEQGEEAVGMGMAACAAQGTAAPVAIEAAAKVAEAIGNWLPWL